MSLISKPYTFTVGATIIASEHNANFDTIYNNFNGGIDNSNISASASIAYSKLNLNASIQGSDLTTIATAGKISGASFTALSSIPAGAGQIPIANLSSGAAVQVVNLMDGAVATGTTVIPYDDSIPQNGEGNQYMSLAITPQSATSKLKIDVVINISSSASGGSHLTAALFQDSTASALAAVSAIGGGNEEAILNFSLYMVSGTTSATTFKVRAGANNAGTTTFNGSGAARIFGGVMASSMTITEISS